MRTALLALVTVTGPMVVVRRGEPITGGPHAVQSVVSGTPSAGRVPVSPAPPRSF